MASKRKCAYCGLVGCGLGLPARFGKKRCTYRAGRVHLGYKGGESISSWNISDSTTLGEFKNSLAEAFPLSSDDTVGVWRWSFTKRGEKK